MQSRLSRRAVMAGAAALSAAACAPRAAEAAAPRIGVQLYTVRDRMAEDMAGTLEAVARIGYQEVEFAGYFDTPPAGVRQYLDDAGLQAPAAHIAFTDVRDNPELPIERAVVVEHQTLIVAWLPEEERRTLDQWRAWADRFNGFAEQCRGAGLRFAYHNHDFEFQPIDGVKPFDLLLERCDPALVDFELDLFWAVKAGEDVNAILAANPNRYPCCHVKDMAADGSMVDVGDGRINFVDIFARHDFAHHFVEHDNPGDSLASITASHAALARILAGN